MRNKKKESLLPDGWSQQEGDEDPLHPQGRDCDGTSRIGVARTGPTMLGEIEKEDKLIPDEDRVRRKRIMEKSWELIRWITQYIDSNKEKWE